MRFTSDIRKSNRGFTLIELMIVLAITGILAAIAVPSYLNYVIETRLMGHTQFLAESLHLARVQAVTLSEPVSVCASTDGATCSGSNWEDGWIVFIDNDAPGTLDGWDEVLRAKFAYDDGTTLNVSAPASGGANYIQIDPSTIRFVNCEGCFDDGSRHQRNYADGAGWAGRTLLAVFGINDAMAGNHTGGFQSGCSNQNSSNSANSAQCNAPLATFQFCSNAHRNEPGRSITIMRTGTTDITKIRCD